MAIEIKELRIKVNVIESDELPFLKSEKMSAAKLHELKAAIINECTSKVLEKIKEKEER